MNEPTAAAERSEKSLKGEFRDLMHQVCQGSDTAAWNVVERYGPYVINAIRRRLNDDMRSKFDSQDFAQAVWTSFFRAPKQFHDLEKPEQLIGQ